MRRLILLVPPRLTMSRALLLLPLWTLAACAGGQITPAGQAAITTGVAAAVTLAQAAAAENKTVAQVLAGGQLVCQAGPAVYAVLAANGKTSSVIDQTSTAVASACKGLAPNAVPIPAPAGAETIPAVVVGPTVALPAQKPAA